MTKSRGRFRRFLYFAAAVLFVAQAPRGAFAEGGFSKIREDVRSTESAPPKPPREESRRHRHHDYDDEGPGLEDIPGFTSLAMLVGLGTAYAIASPFWGPAAILNDHYESDAYFADFPYSDHHDGSLVFSHMSCDCGALLGENGTPGEHAPYCSWHYGSSKTSLIARRTDSGD